MMASTTDALKLSTSPCGSALLGRKVLTYMPTTGIEPYDFMLTTQMILDGRSSEA